MTDERLMMADIERLEAEIRRLREALEIAMGALEHFTQYDTLKRLCAAPASLRSENRAKHALTEIRAKLEGGKA